MPIRILLADNHETIRAGLRSLIEKESDMEVIAETDDIAVMVDFIKKEKPDLIIMEVGMHGTKNIDMIRKTTGTTRKTQFICMSMYDEEVLVREVFKAGATGYLVKHHAFEELVPAIRCVMTGNVWEQGSNISRRKK
jgi:two-component system, NarL family, response regulator NreC